MVIVMVFFDLLILHIKIYVRLITFFGRLLMSQDISPTWIVLLESIYRIIQVFFHIFPMSQDSIRIRFPMSILDHFNFS
jgi:hypothetical protein